ncbi:hypothetical protein ScPMuIL_006815 [Solemya velum]
MAELCIACNDEVRPRQHAITCDVCDRLQHRTCDTGISLANYRNAIREGTEIHFICSPCVHQQLHLNVGAHDFIEMEADIPDVTEVVLDMDDIADIRDFPDDTVDDIPDHTADDIPDHTADDIPDDTADDIPDDTADFNVTFDLPYRHVIDRPETVDTSFDIDEELPHDIVPDEPITFKLLEKRSKTGGQILVQLQITNTITAATSGKTVVYGWNIQNRWRTIQETRKRKDDYAEVLRALKQALDVVKVRTFVLDFEKGAWQAVREVFLDVEKSTQFTGHLTIKMT